MRLSSNIYFCHHNSLQGTWACTAAASHPRTRAAQSHRRRQHGSPAHRRFIFCSITGHQSGFRIDIELLEYFAILIWIVFYISQVHQFQELGHIYQSYGEIERRVSRTTLSHGVLAINAYVCNVAFVHKLWSCSISFPFRHYIFLTRATESLSYIRDPPNACELAVQFDACLVCCLIAWK